MREIAAGRREVVGGEVVGRGGRKVAARKEKVGG